MGISRRSCRSSDPASARRGTPPLIPWHYGAVNTDSPAEAALLRLLAREIDRLGAGRILVAVDGVDGSGKTTFAGHLAEAITGRPVLLIHADDFLNVREVRHRRGARSPEGFWLDTYDYAALEREVLTPLHRDGTGTYRTAATDPRRNVRVDPPPRQAPDDAVVLVEGMFLHRSELAHRWDYSVFLAVPFVETARRMALRDGTHPDPGHPTMRRYVEGQRLYFSSDHPWRRATRVVDNTVPAHPRLMSAGDLP